MPHTPARIVALLLATLTGVLSESESVLVSILVKATKPTFLSGKSWNGYYEGKTVDALAVKIAWEAGLDKGQSDIPRENVEVTLVAYGGTPLSSLQFTQHGCAKGDSYSVYVAGVPPPASGFHQVLNRCHTECREVNAEHSYFGLECPGLQSGTYSGGINCGCYTEAKLRENEAKGLEVPHVKSREAVTESCPGDNTLEHMGWTYTLGGSGLSAVYKIDRGDETFTFRMLAIVNATEGGTSTAATAQTKLAAALGLCSDADQTFSEALGPQGQSMTCYIVEKVERMAYTEARDHVNGKLPPPPSPPPPSPPSLPPPSDVASDVNTSPNDAPAVLVTWTVAGDVSSVPQDAIKTAIATATGVPVANVALTLVAGSVVIYATITPAPGMTASTISSAISTNLGSVAQASTSFGVTVEVAAAATVTTVGAADAAATTVNTAAGGGEKDNSGALIGGIVGGAFVPTLMFILWMGGAFAKYGCPSPLKKKKMAPAGVPV